MSRAGALLVAVLVGCGGSDYCESSRKWLEECGGTVSDAELDQCKELLEPCSASDQKALVDSTECLMDAGVFSYCPDDETPTTSTTGDLDELTQKLIECNAILADVSPGCIEAVSFSGTTVTQSGFTSSQ